MDSPIVRRRRCNSPEGGLRPSTQRDGTLSVPVRNCSVFIVYGGGGETAFSRNRVVDSTHC